MIASSKSRALLCVCSLCLALSACVPSTLGISRFTPPPKDPFEGVDHVQLTHTAALASVSNARIRPSTAILGKRAVTLEDCRGLAVSNSVEAHQSYLDELTQDALETSNKTKLLPHALFSGEGSIRDNESLSYSEVLGQEGVEPQPGSSGTGVTNFSTGHDRTTWRYSFETRWSPTDAALAYYLVKSSRNEKRKHHYVRVRIIQRLFGVVDSAFARLLYLQKTIPMAANLAGIRTRVAHNAEDLFARNLIQAEDYHRAKQKLIKAKRLLTSLRNEAEQQRNLLASAMNVSPNYCIDGGFFVVGVTKPICVQECISDLEMRAIRFRPEAYRAGLDQINSVNDLKRTIVKYFPKITGYWRYTRDRDKHNYNKDWKELGVLAYFDLLDLCTNLFENKAAGLLTEKTYDEIGVVALGITTQVRTAAIKYYDALDQLNAAEESAASSARLLKIQRERARREAQAKVLILEAEADLLNEQIDALRAAGEAQAGWGELQAATGENYNEPLAH
jgi:outer membrane protein TolC